MAEDYTQYNNLSEYHKRCICTTNFWLLVYNRPIIPVPPSDVEYWEKWNGYNRKKAEELQAERNAWVLRQ